MHARAAVDDRDVAEGLAGIQRAQLSTLHGDVCRTLEDEMESNAVASDRKSVV
jgi:hypothetical protein